MRSLAGACPACDGRGGPQGGERRASGLRALLQEARFSPDNVERYRQALLDAGYDCLDHVREDVAAARERGQAWEPEELKGTGEGRIRRAALATIAREVAKGAPSPAPSP